MLQRLTLESITRELNETLRRKEEARIYHWHQRTGLFPARRAGVVAPAEQSVTEATSRPP